MNTPTINSAILTLVTFIPLAGALLLMLFPRRDRDIRVFALVVSLLTFVLSLHLPAHFHRLQSGFQFELNVPWIPTPNIHYHMGVDGISMWLVVLTTFLTPLCVLISWKSIHDRVKEFFILFLILETALIGVFVSLDLFLFYFFWEATLIPMALLIGICGHGRRVYAAVKFFLYTMIASVFMLAAILWLYAKAGTFDFVTIQNAIRNGQVENFAAAAPWLFLGFFIAFAVKVPLFPFHTWLPDAHVEAPTAGSVLLAGVLLKMGTYGMLRFNLGLFPEQARAQCLVDHGSGADRHHLWRAGRDGAAQHEEADRLLVDQPPRICCARHFQLHSGGLDGAMFVMLAHGVSTGGLFMLAGILYERRHTYEISEFGGLATPHADVRDVLSLFILLASVGLPLLNGFIGEFLVLSGAFQAIAGLRHSGRDRRDLERLLSAVDVSARVLRQGYAR